MFSLQSPLDVTPDCVPQPARVTSVPGRRPSAPPTIDEAYEMRLLAEVARWDDQAAFEQIYARHHGAVVRAVRKICRDADTVEEIAQHTFTALWIRAERLIDKSVRLRPWLTTVARNAAIDHVRGERFCDPIDAAAGVPSSEPTPADVALSHEVSAELRAALGRLSPEQRAAVELVYFAGMTYGSAANALGEPSGTVKSRVRLALGHLRADLANRTRPRAERSAQAARG